MANRSSVILEKKLQELESELRDIIRLPVDPTHSNPRLLISFDDIRQRFVFLNKLLLREVASQPQNSDQLDGIGQRLAALEATWNEWRLSSVCSDCRTQTDGDAPVSETGSFSGENSPEIIPRGDREKKKKECDREPLSDSTSDSDDFSGEEDETERKEEMAAGRGKMGKYGGVFGCGMIVGAVWMEILFFVSYKYFVIENQDSLLPPT